MVSLKSYHRSRPVRVAFLVEETPDYPALFDAIFSDCHSRWGGRFNLIVPCENGAPIDGYKDWLSAYDPDLIYSYVNLTDQQVEEFHGTYFPSFLTRHDIPASDSDRTARDFRPRLPIEALSSLSVIGSCKNYKLLDHSSVKLVVGRSSNLAPSSFLDDSFSSFEGAFKRSPFPRAFRDVARAVTVAPPEIVNPRHGFLDGDETVPSVIDLLVKMSNQTLLTFSQLSAAAVPRREIPEGEWSRGFSIIVGDSFIDRITFWNGRSLFPVWLDEDFVTVRIPISSLDDTEFLSALAGFIGRNNHVSGFSGSSQPTAIIRSYEIDTDALDALKDQMQEIDKWSQYKVEKINGVGDCTPTSKNWKRSNFLRSGGGIGSAIGQWDETVYEGSELRITPKPPDHLRHLPSTFVGPGMGAWAIDLDIEREANLSGIANIQHRWRLPRKLRFVSSFLKSYPISEPHGRLVAPRTCSEGFLTLYSVVGAQLPTINIPSDEQAFVSALTSGRDWWPFTPPEGGGSGMPDQLCTYIRSSSQGRYFTGVLGLFGGLEEARDILLHDLWVKLFEKMGASSKTTDTRVNEIQDQLKNKISLSTIDMTDEQQSEKLSRLILKIARSQRIGPISLPWHTIEMAFSDIQDAYFKKHPAADDKKYTEVDERKDDQNRFERTVQKLSVKGVLHQGNRLKCSECFHESWVSIGNLDIEIECEVCGKVTPAPIRRGWDFMLNSFLAVALREHGVQPLIWALDRMRSLYSSSFYFLGPTDVYLDQYPEDAIGSDGDIDLTCVIDGVVRCCEVKQSGRNLNLDNFVSLVKRLRPDIATLAVMEERNSKIEKKFTWFAEKLSGSGIGAELIVLEPDDFDKSPAFETIRYRVF